MGAIKFILRGWGGKSPAFLIAAPALCFFAAMLPASSRAQSGHSADNAAAPLLHRAQQLIATNNLEAARTVLLQGAKDYPHEAAFYNFLGVVDAQERDFTSAETNFRRAIKEAPRYTGAYLNLGHLYQAGAKPGEVSLALRTYEQLLQFDPLNPEANFQAAFLETRLGRFNAALAHLHQMPEADKQKPAALALRCVDEARSGAKTAAQADARRLIASPSLTEQDIVPILPDLDNEPDLALELVQALNQRRLASPATQRLLGDLQEKTGHLAEARKTLEAVADAEPGQIAPLIELARVANQQKDYRGALGYLAHARALEPNNADVNFFFGMVCVEMDLHQEAWVSLKKAVELDPGNAYYNYALGAVASQRQDAGEAVPYFKKYCALKPLDPRGELALGAAYYYAHNLGAARAELLKIADDKSTAAGAAFFLGRVANDEGDWVLAGQYLRQSIRDDPANASAYAALGGAYLGQKSYDAAEKALLHAIRIEPDSYLANLNLMILYQRTRNPRAGAQSRRFAALREKREQRAKLFLRTIRVVPGPGR